MKVKLSLSHSVSLGQGYFSWCVRMYATRYNLMVTLTDELSQSKSKSKSKKYVMFKLENRFEFCGPMHNEIMGSLRRLVEELTPDPVGRSDRKGFTCCIAMESAQDFSKVDHRKLINRVSRSIAGEMLRIEPRLEELNHRLFVSKSGLADTSNVNFSDRLSDDSKWRDTNMSGESSSVSAYLVTGVLCIGLGLTAVIRSPLFIPVIIGLFAVTAGYCVYKHSSSSDDSQAWLSDEQGYVKLN
jgi:hypothetical protein